MTGNGLYIPYAEEFPNHQVYGDLFLKSLHEAFPKALFGIMGIEVPCVNGGVTACYGASGYYNDWYGYMVSVLNYDKWLEEQKANNCDNDCCSVCVPCDCCGCASGCAY